MIKRNRFHKRKMRKKEEERKDGSEKKAVYPGIETGKKQQKRGRKKWSEVLDNESN